MSQASGRAITTGVLSVPEAARDAGRERSPGIARGIGAAGAHWEQHVRPMRLALRPNRQQGNLMTRSCARLLHNARPALMVVVFGPVAIGPLGTPAPVYGAVSTTNGSNPVTIFGGTGPGVGHFASAQGIAVEADGSVLITDQTRSNILHYANDGTYLGSFGSAGSGATPIQFSSPQGIAVDPAGKDLVADFGNQRIDVLSPSDLSFVGFINFSSAWPEQVAANTDSIYVLLNSGAHQRLSKYSNDASLTIQATHDIANGFGDDQMALTAGTFNQIAVDSSGDVLIVDSENQRVVIYDSSLNFVRAWSMASSQAAGLAIGYYAGTEQVYTGNWSSQTSQFRVVRGDALGNPKGAFNCHGFLSVALATDQAGDVFITDSNRIMRVAPSPIVSVAATPSDALTSQSVMFDGSASTVPFWSIGNYRWGPERKRPFSHRRRRSADD